MCYILVAALFSLQRDFLAKFHLALLESYVIDMYDCRHFSHAARLARQKQV